MKVKRKRTEVSVCEIINTNIKQKVVANISWEKNHKQSQSFKKIIILAT